ncbi:MAG: histidine phosphatase family protein [Candidatus Moraniibacteriota bacterium]
MAKLILARHGKSAYNKLGLWTGHTDVDLDEDGHIEAECAGKALCGITIHHAHVSQLKRTHQTLDGIKRGLGLGIDDLVPVKHHALNERHYGIHTGKNKWEVKESVGEEEFRNIRRHWNHPIPEGETLKDVHDRVVPYYKESIQPDLVAGRNVIVVAHGNTLRALVKYLENIAEELIADLEIGTGEVYCYDINVEGNITGKEVRGAEN